MSRAATIQQATQHLTEHVGRKRAAVFAAVAQDLTEGPAPVPYWTIFRRVKTGPVFVPLHYKRRDVRGGGQRLDQYTSSLVADGWLTIVREGQPGSARVWDLGPAVTEVVAS